MKKVPHTGVCGTFFGTYGTGAPAGPSVPGVPSA